MVLGEGTVGKTSSASQQQIRTEAVDETAEELHRSGDCRFLWKRDEPRHGTSSPCEDSRESVAFCDDRRRAAAVLALHPALFSCLSAQKQHVLPGPHLAKGVGAW